MLITYYKYQIVIGIHFQNLIKTLFCPITVEFEEDEVSRNLEAAGNMKMASNCTSQAEAVIDSGVDSEATTPSSPEDDPHEHEAENQNSRSNKSATLAPSICKSRINSIDEEASPGQQLSDDMVLETAETLLALSGKSKSASNGDTAIVRPRQPPQSPANQGKILAFFSSFTILIFFIPTTTTLAFFK